MATPKQKPVPKVATAAQPKFVPTRHTNMVRSTATNVYFVRASVAGRLIRKSLKTDIESVAVLRLADLLKTERARAKVVRNEQGRLVVRQLADEWLLRSEGSDSRDRTKEYHRECAETLKRTWPELFEREVSTVTEDECRAWSRNLKSCRGTPFSPTRFNGLLTALQGVFEVGIGYGAIERNPARVLERRSVELKRLVLPTSEQFNRLLDFLATPKLSKTRKPLPYMTRGADMVKFLAYSGARLDEAKKAACSDIDWARQTLTLHGKGGRSRTIPMIAELAALLKDMQSRPHDREGMILPIVGVKKVLPQACKAIGIEPITHHDLRHLFATRCIESGVDIPTVSRWLGHQDGGAVAMRIYGHLRDEHSKAMAAKVKFSG